jgi:hypothetical protein
MPDILAIISKAIFEQQAQKGGKLLGPGAVLPLDRYTSKNKALAPLGQGGRLVLVTVRPPNERLWLVAILEDPVFQGDAWVAPSPNRVPITDISKLRKTIKLVTGKGLSQDKGALGMSLQTPRALAPDDMAALLAAASGAPAEDVLALLPQTATPQLRSLAEALAKSPDDEALRERVARGLVGEGAGASASTLLSSLKHLNEHEKGAELPCLCKKCIGAAPAEVTAIGMTFGRDFVVKSGRVLHFWAPKEVLALGGDMHKSVRAALSRQLGALAKARKVRARLAAEERRLARERKKKRGRTRAG